MKKLPAGEPTWEIVFDEDGKTKDFDRETFFQQLHDEDVEDLFIFSHGWNNDANAARSLYDAMFPLIADAYREAPRLGKNVGFMGVVWPSVWFPETPARVEGTSGSEQATEGPTKPDASGSDALTGAEIAASLLPAFTSDADQERIREVGRLIDRGTASFGEDEEVWLEEDEQEKLIREIHENVRSLLPETAIAAEDGGEATVLTTESPEKTYQSIAQVFGSAPREADTEGAGDWFRRALEGSKDMVRILSYTIMKARAGKVGSVGLGALLADFATRADGVRVHLLGHSFGARLVSFALTTVGPAKTSPVHSLVLIQGAFSHFAFSHAHDNPFGKDGALHQYADRVRGPLVATYSAFDYAVGRWYPKASFLAQEDTEGKDMPSRWAGMGGDGFQAVTPLTQLSLLAKGPTEFNFAPRGFYRVDAGWVIDDVDQSAFSGAHSDIRKVPVAQMVAAAAGAYE